MDKAVASSYGWDDLDLNSEFQDTTRGKRFTVSDETKTEILSRLFELNNQRFLEEELETKKENRTRKNAIINRNFNKHSQPDNVDQMRFELEEEPLSSKKLEIASRQSEAISIDQLERWNWYRCLSCGAAVMGFNAKDHIIEKHGNIDVGFALPNSKKE
jgi:hypothetical protein